jgi:hypothetical protein
MRDHCWQWRSPLPPVERTSAPPVVVPVPSLSFEQKAAAISGWRTSACCAMRHSGRFACACRGARYRTVPASSVGAAAVRQQGASGGGPPLPSDEWGWKRRAAFDGGARRLRPGSPADGGVRARSLGDKSAHDGLVKALADESPLVRGSAAGPSGRSEIPPPPIRLDRWSRRSSGRAQAAWR